MESSKDMLSIFEKDWENCLYSEISYEEYDTGYKEYECSLLKNCKLNTKCYCYGGDINNGCPLSFKYKIEK